MPSMSDNKKWWLARCGLAAGIITLGLLALATWPVSGADWIFSPGPYTNDPKTGRPVDQYQPEAAAVRVPYDKYFSADGPDPFGMYDTQDGLFMRPPIEYEGLISAPRQ